MSQLENNVTKSGYYLGLDMGTDSVGWQLQMINIIYCVPREKTCGA